MKIITLLLISFVTASCSSDGSRAQPEQPYKLDYTFYTEKNYQQVYRDVLKNSQECKKQNTLSKMIPSGQYFDEIKAADISISVHGIFGNYTHLTVNIEAEDSKTKVHVSNNLESWDKLAHAIKKWIIDDVDDCE